MKRERFLRFLREKIPEIYCKIQKNKKIRNRSRFFRVKISRTRIRTPEKMIQILEKNKIFLFFLFLLLILLGYSDSA